MRLNKLLDILQCKYTIVSKNIVKDIDVRAVCLANDSENMTATENDVLYIAAYSNGLLQTSGTILYCMENDQSEVDDALISDMPSVNNNRVLVSAQGHSPVDIQCDVQSILLEDQRMDKIYLGILSTLLESNRISDVLNQVADIQENSLAVIDMSGKILAHSEPFRVEDPIWTNAIQDGFCPSEFMEHVRYVRSQHKQDSRKQAFVRYCEAFEVFYLCSEIHISDMLYGYVFMMQKNADFDPVCKDIVSFIGKAVGRSITNAERVRLRTDQIRSGVIADIIRGARREEALSRIASSGIAFPSYMRLIIVQNLYGMNPHDLDESVLKTVKDFFGDSYCIQYADSAVIIVALDSKKRIEESSLEKLKSYCKEKHMITGISSYFSDPLDIRPRYGQTLRILQLAENMNLRGSLFMYEELFFYDMLGNFQKEKDKTVFCHPALKILKDYDQQKGTHLYETLAAYIRHGFNQADTAIELKLHRNTLAYRRTRIEELTGVDLDNTDERFFLRCSYNMNTFLQDSTENSI